LGTSLLTTSPEDFAQLVALRAPRPAAHQWATLPESRGQPRAKRASRVCRPDILRAVQRRAIVPDLSTYCAAGSACERGQQCLQASGCESPGSSSRHSIAYERGGARPEHRMWVKAASRRRCPCTVRPSAHARSAKRASRVGSPHERSDPMTSRRRGSLAVLPPVFHLLRALQRLVSVPVVNSYSVTIRACERASSTRGLDIAYVRSGHRRRGRLSGSGIAAQSGVSSSHAAGRFDAEPVKEQQPPQALHFWRAVRRPAIVPDAAQHCAATARAGKGASGIRRPYTSYGRCGALPTCRMRSSTVPPRCGREMGPAACAGLTLRTSGAAPCRRAGGQQRRHASHFLRAMRRRAIVPDAIKHCAAPVRAG